MAGPVVISILLVEMGAKSRSSSGRAKGFLSKLDFAGPEGEVDEGSLVLVGVAMVIGLVDQRPARESRTSKGSVGVRGCEEGEFGVRDDELEEPGEGEAKMLSEAEGGGGVVVVKEEADAR